MVYLLVVPSLRPFGGRICFHFFGIKRETRIEDLRSLVIIPSMFFGYDEDPFPAKNFLLDSYLVIFGVFQLFRRIYPVERYHYGHKLILATSNP